MFFSSKWYWFTLVVLMAVSIPFIPVEALALFMGVSLSAFLFYVFSCLNDPFRQSLIKTRDQMFFRNNVRATLKDGKHIVIAEVYRVGLFSSKCAFYVEGALENVPQTNTIRHNHILTLECGSEEAAELKYRKHTRKNCTGDCYNCHP